MDYTLTKKEVEKLLGKSSKTISRYIKQGKLHPVKQKRGGYDIYLFDMEEVSRLKVGDIGDTEGGQVRGQGTKEGTFDTPPTPDNTDRVNNLHGERQGTNQETFKGKKDTTGDTPQDIGDRTQGTPETDTLLLLRDTIEILKEQLDRQDKQIKDMTNTMQFALKEVSEYRQMLALPNPVTNTVEGEVGDIIDRTQDKVGDKRQETQGTKSKGQGKDKPVNKAKQNKGHSGQNKGQSKGQNNKPKQPPKQTPKQTPKSNKQNKPDKQNKPQNKPEVKKEIKKDNKKRRFLSWIFR